MAGDGPRAAHGAVNLLALLAVLLLRLLRLVLGAALYDPINDTKLLRLLRRHEVVALECRRCEIPSVAVKSAKIKDHSLKRFRASSRLSPSFLQCSA